MNQIKAVSTIVVRLKVKVSHTINAVTCTCHLSSYNKSYNTSLDLGWQLWVPGLTNY